VDPIAIAGAFRIFVNAYIGPVPALEILKRYFPNDLRAASVTSETNACLEFVLAGASPWYILISISPNPLLLR